MKHNLLVIWRQRDAMRHNNELCDDGRALASQGVLVNTVEVMRRGASRRAFGLDFATLHHLTGGNFGVHDVPCPVCAPFHNPTRKVLRIWLRSGFASFKCQRCGAKGYVRDGTPGQKITAEDRQKLERQIAAQRARDQEREQQRIRAALLIWHEAASFHGTIAERYLVKHRKHDVREIELDHVLRWNPFQRALVALMTDPVSGNPTGVHRTFLDHTGAKVERRMKGRKGVIRVTPDEGVGHALAIAEGLEDAIAVLLDGAGPVWAACDKDNLKKLPILPGVECLTIFSDRGAGEAEAQACARRWREAGREALVISTYREGGDE